MRWRIPTIALAVPILAFLAYACTDSTILVEPAETGGVISFAIISGQDQVAHPDQELPEPLVVQATEMGADGKEAVVSGVVVNFVVTFGGGSVWAGAAATDKDGIAADYLTLGPEYYVTNRVEVRSVDSDGQKHVWDTFTAMAKEDATPPWVSFVLCSPDPDNPQYPAEDCSFGGGDTFSPGDEYLIFVDAVDYWDPVTRRAGMSTVFDGRVDGQPVFGVAIATSDDPPSFQATSPVLVVPPEYKGGETIPIVVWVIDDDRNIGTAVGELVVAKK